MDIDISDILAEVSRPIHPSQTSNTGSGGAYTHLDSSTSFSDHQLLVRAWTSERCSPSLLPYPTALIDRTMQRIRDQIARIEDTTAGVSDPYATTKPAAGNHNNTNLILSILQTDLGRTQFLMRSYLRQRLAKLTKHAVYYLKSHDDDSTELLSPAEKAFLRNHQALLSRFYDDTFLASFPVSLRRLDDRAGGVDMVEGPDWDGVVVVRCLREGEWGNEEQVAEQGEGDGGEGATTELRLRRDEVWVVRWRDVRKGVLNGDLELL